MKKITILSACLLCGTLLSLLGSCGAEEDINANNGCSGCEDIEALSEYDDSNLGVYKGVLLTGTGIGHFRLNLKNGDDRVFILLKYTRESLELVDSLKVSGNLNIVEGSPITATMIGAGSKTEIYIANNGTNLNISDFTLSGSIGTGAKPQATMFKELSDEQVKVYEGTMQEATASSTNGKVGFIIRGNAIEGFITSAANSLRESFYDGTLDASGNFSFTFSGNNSVYSGKVTGSDITGSYTIQGTAAGTFAASRSY